MLSRTVPVDPVTTFEKGDPSTNRKALVPDRPLNCRYRYSALMLQLFQIANSKPPPIVQPAFVFDTERASAPGIKIKFGFRGVITIVCVYSSFVSARPPVT